MTVNKKYYEVLDGLRGIAAILVLIFHYYEMIYWPAYESIPIGHGYLAVDFFFCLSGFVIAFAYDGRIRKVGNRNFIVNRLIRLHPMVVMGAVLGLISYVANPYMDITIGAGTIILAFVFSLFLIPFPGLQHREVELFPLNTPTWSLFFEYIANVVYMLVLSRVNRFILLVLGILSGAFLVFCGQRSGWLINGWSLDFISDGFARVSFSFIAGILVYRFKWILTNKLGFVFTSALLVAALIVPHTANDWVLECFLVMVCFPLIICLGAGTTANGGMRKIALFLGRLSYPLYLTHVPLVSFFNSFYRANGLTGWQLVLTAVAMGILNIIIAWVVLRFYDEPVRRWLKKTGR